MTPEALVQGEKDTSKLGESLVLGFMADGVVRALTAAELGRDLGNKRKSLRVGFKFLSQTIREVRRDLTYPDQEVIQALLKTREEVEGVPRQEVIDLQEIVDYLKEYQSIVERLAQGKKVEVGKTMEARWFFTHFSEAQLTRSSTI